MLSGAGFRRQIFAIGAPAVPAELGAFAFRLWSNFLGLPALLGVVGLAAELRRRSRVHVGLLVMLLGHVIFYVLYGARDKEIMFLPAYLIWGIWIGLGARAAAGWIGPHLGLGAAPQLAPAALALIAALLVLINSRLADVSGDWSARRHGEAILAELQPNAIFIGSWPDVRLVEYLQQAEGVRRDVQPDDVFFSPTAERTRRIRLALQSGRPVYVAVCEDLPDAAITCEYRPACGCYQLSRRPPP